MTDDSARFEPMLKAFAGYILVDHWPKFWDQTDKKTGGSSKAPWPLMVVANLVANNIDEIRFFPV
jgi:hypothetical protein